MTNKDIETSALFYEEVSKSRRLIRAHIKGENSALSNRIMMALIAQVDYENPDWCKQYTVKLSDLVEKSGVEINRSVVNEIANAMVTTAVKFIEGKRDVWRPFFKEIAYCNGEISATFNELIYPVIAHLEGFIKYNYLDYLKLNSAYSQQLWELLTMFRHSAINSPKYGIKDLQGKLGIPEKLRGKFQFTQRILDRAKIEIEKKTDLRFVWERSKKDKREVVFYLGRMRLPKLEEQEKQKTAEQNEKTLQIQKEYSQCIMQHPDGCEHYAKSKKPKCALCRKMKTFTPKNNEPNATKKD